jgi:hypothetical protein
MFPWKKKKQQGWETRQHGWTEGTYEDIQVPSRVLTVTNRSAIINYHVSIIIFFWGINPSSSLSLSEIVTSMLISRCQAIVSLTHTHTHRRLDAYFQVLKHRLSLSHRIVTSMLISRCQTIVSLSHRIVTSMLISRCQTIVSLSLSWNCHLDAYF